MGYLRCALELIEQLDEQALKIDQLVVATGSAGTQAGLLAGLIIAGVDIPVLGITVSRPGSEQEQLVLTLLQQILQRLGLDPALANGKVHANGDYYGASYGVVTQDSLNAITTTAQTEGILLDPVYTGKAMAGLIDLCQRGIIAKGSTQLFLHTGGSQALPAYISAFN